MLPILDSAIWRVRDYGIEKTEAIRGSSQYLIADVSQLFMTSTTRNPHQLLMVYSIDESMVDNVYLYVENAL